MNLKSIIMRIGKNNNTFILKFSLYQNYLFIQNSFDVSYFFLSIYGERI